MPWRPWEDVLALVELVAPTACGGCGRAGERWCPACDAVLTGTPPHRWAPTPCPPRLPPTWSGPAYDGPVREAVVAWKDGGRADLTVVLAPVLRDVVAAALEAAPAHRAALEEGGGVTVVPAPSGRSSTRQRGEHRVRALALAAVGRGQPLLPVVDALRLARPVSDQAGLGSAERARNLGGAVRVHGPGLARVHRRPCLLVDDVITTGATLQECARALREAGSGPVLAVTVAATRRRGSGLGTAGGGPAGLARLPLPEP